MPDWEVVSESPLSKSGSGNQWEVVDEKPLTMTDKAVQAVPAEDMVKSGGIGLVKGAIGLAGLPGDVAELGARGINAAVQGIGSMTGLDVGPSRKPQAPTYGSADIEKGLTKFTGPLYEPKTTAGKYVEQVGEFVPGMIGGPGSLAGKFMTRAVLPGLAAETAGQLTEGTAAEPYARTAAGLAAGLRYGKGNAARPTSEQLAERADQLYKHPAVSNVTFQPAAIEAALGNIESNIAQKVRPHSAPETFDILSSERARHAPQTNALAGMTGLPPTKPPAPVTIENLKNVRDDLQAVRMNFKESNARDRLAANIAIREIDDFLANLKQPALLTGNAQEANKLLREARGNWAAHKRTELADEKIASALMRAESGNSGQNVENALRQNIRTILEPKNKKLRAGWSQEELDAARKFVRGTWTANKLREVGNRLGGNLSLTAGLAGLGVGYGSGNTDVGAMGLVPFVAGRAMKGIGNSLTKRRAHELSKTLASRSPLAEQWRAQGRTDPVSPLRLTVGAATYGDPFLQEYLGRQKGGKVEQAYAVDSPEFKEEVRQALLRNPDSPAWERANRNRRNYLPDSPESTNIEDRRQQGGPVEDENLDPVTRMTQVTKPYDYLYNFQDISGPTKYTKDIGGHKKQRGGSVSIKTKAGTHTIPVEVASTRNEQRKGLAGRRTLAKGSGMLFDLHSERPTSFWMNKTRIPLDMIFIGGDGRITGIAPNRVPYTKEKISGVARRVLEVNAGTAKRLGLAVGDRVA